MYEQDYIYILPSSAVEAIRKARANGHKVYISTGRSRAEVYQEIWDIGLDGMIGGNGSYVEDNGQVVMHQLLTAEQSHRIVDWLHERKLEFYLESNNGLFASENFETRGEPVMQEYSARKGQDNAAKMTVRQAFPEMIFGGELYRDDLNKVSFILESYEDFLAAKEAFPDLQAGTWGGVGETALFGDLGVKGITKAHAIDALLQHIGGKINAGHLSFEGSFPQLGRKDHTCPVGQHQIRPIEQIAEFLVFAGVIGNLRIWRHHYCGAVALQQRLALCQRLLHRQVIKAQAENVLLHNGHTFPFYTGHNLSYFCAFVYTQAEKKKTDGKIEKACFFPFTK